MEAETQAQRNARLRAELDAMSAARRAIRDERRYQKRYRKAPMPYPFTRKVIRRPKETADLGLDDLMEAPPSPKPRTIRGDLINRRQRERLNKDLRDLGL